MSAGISSGTKTASEEPGDETTSTEETLHLAIAQVEQFRECPNKGMAHFWGKKMSADPRATSPGLYDIMIAVPDEYEMDGVRWEVEEEIRP
jgi:hypothetical protein